MLHGQIDCSFFFPRFLTFSFRSANVPVGTRCRVNLRIDEGLGQNHNEGVNPAFWTKIVTVTDKSDAEFREPFEVSTSAAFIKKFGISGIAKVVSFNFFSLYSIF